MRKLQEDPVGGILKLHVMSFEESLDTKRFLSSSTHM